jgi:hypothetical protein
MNEGRYLFRIMYKRRLWTPVKFSFEIDAKRYNIIATKKSSGQESIDNLVTFAKSKGLIIKY